MFLTKYVVCYWLYFGVLTAKSLDKFNMDKEERSCYNTIIPKPKCFFKLNCDPMRYYCIKEQEDGKMYYIPTINPAICNDFDSKFRNYPFLLSSKKYGVRLIHTYHDILKRYCINENNDGKFYYIPNSNEDEVNQDRLNSENNFLNDYCKEHYRHVDFSDPDNNENIHVAIHLPDINSRLMKPYKFPVSTFRSERNIETYPSGSEPDPAEPESESESNPDSEFLDNPNETNEIGPKRYINIAPHYHNGIPCEKCPHDNRDFLDQFDPCDVCEEPKDMDTCTKKTIIVEVTTSYHCDDK